MQDPNSPVICRSCKRTVPLREIKFDSNNKIYVCNACFNASMPKSNGSKPVLRQAPAYEPEPKKFKKTTTFNCSKCKYVFKVAEGKVVKKCPYCGEERVAPASQDDAEKILRESVGWE